ncbi:dATP/dGTP pyrophosphohydrolase domain-containing protein [Klebsiella pneumoniae]|uniref:dATP/dGTP pyrophosphohydrolase domain-containing protein n=1 Tax=Klebsiella pneumoniae TaxID=573 RepID=UPI00374F66FB
MSIREQKFLKLAKAHVQLAAESVALKAGVTYFAYSPEYGFDYFKDKQSAIDTAQAEIDAYREDADDGWSEDVQRVSWGIVIQQAQGFDAQGLHTSDSQHTYQTCNYRLVDSVETPATDRIVAGIKADGVEEWADMQFLLWDAQRRAGITDEQITQAMFEKLAVNKQREWPEPKDGEPRLHIKEQPAPVVPNGLRLALSNAGIAAPESDEMLAATCEKHIQALVTWVKDRKPFQSAPVVPSFEEWLSAANRKPLGWVKDAMREAYDACRAAMLSGGKS